MSKINERIIKETQIILENGYTIREIAKMFNVSKSTVHKDLHERLLKIDKNKHKKVDKILKYHTNIRHIRGGESTKLKYLKCKEG
jgi:putative DeoR family transcriptional regulator (stage III sporulation protein D)